MLIGATVIVLSATFMILAVANIDAGAHMAYVHMCVAAAVAVVFIFTYMRQNAALVQEGANESRLSANTSRQIGLVWTWGAIGLAITYGTGVLDWREWPLFLTACIVLAGLCLFFATLLEKDGQEGREDATMLRIGKILAIVLLVGMIITIVGLIVDGKMTRFLNPRYTDWPANNIFFFGAAAMAVISAHALFRKSQPQQA